jgi:hypothetical protein
MKAKRFKHLMTNWSEKKNNASRYLDKIIKNNNNDSNRKNKD